MEFGDVLWVDDDIIHPPGKKMWVLVSPDRLIFFRINSEGKRIGSVPITRSPDHTFLSWDSHIEAARPIELDDYAIDQALHHGRGVVGRVNRATLQRVLERVRTSAVIVANDQTVILQAFADAGFS